MLPVQTISVPGYLANCPSSVSLGQTWTLFSTASTLKQGPQESRVLLATCGCWKASTPPNKPECALVAAGLRLCP